MVFINLTLFLALINVLERKAQYLEVVSTFMVSLLLSTVVLPQRIIFRVVLQGPPFGSWDPLLPEGSGINS